VALRFLTSFRFSDLRTSFELVFRWPPPPPIGAFSPPFFREDALADAGKRLQVCYSLGLRILVKELTTKVSLLSSRRPYPCDDLPLQPLDPARPVSTPASFSDSEPSYPIRLNFPPLRKSIFTLETPNGTTRLPQRCELKTDRSSTHPPVYLLKHRSPRRTLFSWSIWPRTFLSVPSL